MAELQEQSLFLQTAPGLRMILPPLDGSYAALVNSPQGLVLINRNDTGVGWQLCTRGAYDREQMQLLDGLARAAPPGAVVLDIGANIGIAALTFARAVGPAGLVHAYEPQRAVFHMLAGNMALNSIDNVHCHYLAVGSAPGIARVPRMDPYAGASFGSVELNREQQSEAKQQAAVAQFDSVAQTSVDALALPRIDLIKIDVEGMEAEVLLGAAATLAALHPLLYVEYLKSAKQALGNTLRDAGYELFDAGGNFVGIPRGDSRRDRLAAVLQLQPWNGA
jgi:FkbM family methyltransferase